MTHKYDTNSDQLKCNFCTQWFKCSLHYANLQRYSLKACHQCLNNFTFSILHPQTYRIYKVLLLDSNITIEPSNAEKKDSTLELDLVQQAVKDHLGQVFEEKIKKLIVQLDKSTKRVQQEVTSLKKEFLNKSSTQFEDLTTSSKFLTEQINKIKAYPLEHWTDNKPFKPELKHLPEPKSINKDSQKKLNRNASDVSLASSSKKLFNKQNIYPKNSFCKIIKNKATGLQQSKKTLKSSQFLQIPRSQRPNSMTQSTILKTPRKRLLDSSQMFSYVSSTCHEERDLAQITKLIQFHYIDGISYMPQQVQPQNSAILKTESKRTQADSIIDLRNKTVRDGLLVQLIGSSITKINFECYLKALGAQPRAKTIRIIKTDLSDYEFDALLRFIANHLSVQTLIVTNNRLTDLSVLALHKFKKLHPGSMLQHAYLGSNRIFREKTGSVCRELEEMGLEIYL